MNEYVVTVTFTVRAHNTQEAIDLVMEDHWDEKWAETAYLR